jgi:hypothetical protein
VNFGFEGEGCSETVRAEQAGPGARPSRRMPSRAGVASLVGPGLVHPEPGSSTKETQARHVL